MSTKYKFHNPEGIYFVSFAVQGWVDVFTRNEYKNILVENLKFCPNWSGCSRTLVRICHPNLLKLDL